jgi:23S rRNA pseudouridine2605 synthase
LPKAIARSGIVSRRKAEALILEGHVTVNGQGVTQPGTLVDPERDHIKVDDKLLQPIPCQVYILMNKPRGVMTTMHDPEGRTTVADLLSRIKVRVFPVGRLDYHTEGVLLLTNDGALAQRLLHPRHEMERTYLAKVKGIPTDDALARAQKGILIQRGQKARARVRRHRVLKSNAWLEIVLRQGRHREVRRICEAIGHPVMALKRTRFGPLTTRGLPVGRYRRLTDGEVRLLRKFAFASESAGDSTNKEREMT